MKTLKEMYDELVPDEHKKGRLQERVFSRAAFCTAARVSHYRYQEIADVIGVCHATVLNHVKKHKYNLVEIEYKSKVTDYIEKINKNAGLFREPEKGYIVKPYDLELITNIIDLLIEKKKHYAHIFGSQLADDAARN